MFTEKDLRDFPYPDFDNIAVMDRYMFSTVMLNPLICMKVLRLLLPQIQIGSIQYIRFHKDDPEIFPDDSCYKNHEKFDASLIEYYCESGIQLKAVSGDGKSEYYICLQLIGDKILSDDGRLFPACVSLLQDEQGMENFSPCYMLYLCKSDPFGCGFYQYSFSDRAQEDPNIILNSGIYYRFFNMKGRTGDISPALKDFLLYMDRPSSYSINESDPKLN